MTVVIHAGINAPNQTCYDDKFMRVYILHLEIHTILYFELRNVSQPCSFVGYAPGGVTGYVLSKQRVFFV